ncbi:MAG TPA: MJ1477/TM1410 family putative glycoside hydrolase [Chloroflexota bacterium]
MASNRSDGMASAARAAARPWTAVHNWVYWLDRPRLDQIGASAFELAVIDYSADRTAGGEFTAAQIDALRSGQCSRRVLAYINIGLAESYRFYWDPTWRTGNPAWLGEEDPDWPGHYFIDFWDPAWRQIMYRYLDRVVAQGFDGVYLDRIDSYGDVPGHERDMVELVRGMAAYARARSPLGEDFGVFAQNAEQLAVGHPEYVAVLTGIGREETYFAATDQATSGPQRAAAETALDVVRQGSRGHLVLTVDFATAAGPVGEAYRLSRAKDYVPYATDVALDRLRIDAGFEPSCAALVTPTPLPTATPNPGLTRTLFLPLVLRRASP